MYKIFFKYVFLCFCFNAIVIDKLQCNNEFSDLIFSIKKCMDNVIEKAYEEVGCKEIKDNCKNVFDSVKKEYNQFINNLIKKEKLDEFLLMSHAIGALSLLNLRKSALGLLGYGFLNYKKYMQDPKKD